MTLEALVLGCGVMTLAHANHIRQHWREYDNRAVACAIDRWKQEQRPQRLKGLHEVPPGVQATLPAPDDGVLEALQRLIENAAALGPASQEDALLVARWRARGFAAGVALPADARQKLIEDAITKATGEHRVLNAYDYEDVFACCEAVLDAAGTAGVLGRQTTEEKKHG